MNQKRNSKGKYRKSYLGKLLILLVLSVGVYGVTTEDITATTTYVAEVPQAIKKVSAVIKTLSNETDQAVLEAQKKVEKERTQLLKEIADLQAKQEKKVKRLEELESLGFMPESN